MTKKETLAIIESKIDAAYATARMTAEMAGEKYSDTEVLEKLAPINSQIFGMITVAEALNIRVGRVPFTAATINIWRQHNNNMAA